MRRRDRYGYHTYYGGSGGPSPVIKVIVIVLAVVVLSLILTIVGLQRYMVYSSDGGKLVLPWAQQAEDEGDRADDKASKDKAKKEDQSGDEKKKDDKAKEKKESEDKSDEKKKQDDEPNVDDVVTDENRAEKEKEDRAKQDKPVRAISITRSSLMEGEAYDRLKDRNADALLIEMKDPYGQLSYVSKLDMAEDLGTGMESEEGKDAMRNTLKLLKLRGLYTIAYVDCFEDDALGVETEYSILTNSGYRWRGPNQDIRWASPTNGEVRSYLVGIVGELADLGFDEIMLYNAGYPTEGNLNFIREDEQYNRDDFADIIGDFYEQAAKAASDKGARLSVVSDKDTLQDGKNEDSGQTLDNLSKLDRVWVDPDGAEVKELTDKLTGAGMQGRPLGVLTDELEKDKDYSQAVVD